MINLSCVFCDQKSETLEVCDVCVNRQSEKAVLEYAVQTLAQLKSERVSFLRNLTDVRIDASRRASEEKAAFVVKVLSQLAQYAQLRSVAISVGTYGVQRKASAKSAELVKCSQLLSSVSHKLHRLTHLSLPVTNKSLEKLLVLITSSARNLTVIDVRVPHCYRDTAAPVKAVKLSNVTLTSICCNCSKLHSLIGLASGNQSNRLVRQLLQKGCNFTLPSPEI